MTHYAHSICMCKLASKVTGLKDQVMTQSLFQAWYPPKFKSHVLQDMENFTDWFDPCGSIETVNVKYFVHDIREKRMGGMKSIDAVHSSS